MPNSSIRPQMALLVNCLVVAMSPVVALVVLGQTWINYPYLLRYNRARNPALGRMKLTQHFFDFAVAPCLHSSHSCTGHAAG